MYDDTVLYDVTGRVATITLNRPRLMNAFAGTMREQVDARLREAEADDAVGCVVITGAGRAFCAGGDIDNMVDLQARDDVQPIVQRIAVAARLIGFLMRMRKPVVAAVNGAAAGGGINLALACDMRYCATSATFSESFVKIGVVPDWGGHYLLTRMVGPARAMEMMMTGERIDAAEAFRLGMVNQVFDDATFMNHVRERVARIAHGPAQAIAAIKRGVLLGARGTLEEVLDYESARQRELFLSADAREGMRAFVEKRAPRFGGDR